MSGLSDVDRSSIERRERRVATDCRDGIGRDVRRCGIGPGDQSRRGGLESIRRIYKVVATTRSRIRVLVRSRERSFRLVRSLSLATGRHL